MYPYITLLSRHPSHPFPFRSGLLSHPLLGLTRCIVTSLTRHPLSVQACCRIRSNRLRVLNLGGARRLLRALPQALASAATEPVAERLLLTAAALLEEEAAAGSERAGSSGSSGSVAGGGGGGVGGVGVAGVGGLGGGGVGGGDVGGGVGGGGGGGVGVGEGGGSAGTSSDAVAMEVEGNASDDDDEWAALVEQLLNGLELLRARGESTAAGQGASTEAGTVAPDPATGLCRALTRVLPLAARGRPALLSRLYAHFAPYADFGACDAATGAAAARHAFFLGCLSALLSDPARRAPAASAAAAALKAVAVTAGLAAAGAAYLLAHVPADKDGASQAQWASALGRPALAHVLQLLVPLVRGAADTGAHEALLAPEVMRRIHALERQSSSAAKAIGAWAEALLEALREAGQAEVHLGLYKILVYFGAIVHESTILSFPTPTCMARPDAILLHDYYII